MLTNMPKLCQRLRREQTHNKQTTKANKNNQDKDMEDHPNH